MEKEEEQMSWHSIELQHHSKPDVAYKFNIEIEKNIIRLAKLSKAGEEEPNAIFLSEITEENTKQWSKRDFSKMHSSIFSLMF